MEQVRWTYTLKRGGYLVGHYEHRTRGQIAGISRWYFNYFAGNPDAEPFEAEVCVCECADVCLKERP